MHEQLFERLKEQTRYDIDAMIIGYLGAVSKPDHDVVHCVARPYKEDGFAYCRKNFCNSHECPRLEECDNAVL